MEAVVHYSDLSVCHAFMTKIKWPDGVVKCPKCGTDRVGHITSRRLFQCKEAGCHKQFSVKVGTVMEDSPLSLDKWLVAIWSITNAKNGISSCELARAIGITQKAAWHLLHRVRHAMHVGSFDKFTGEVESDETYVGGLAKFMHKSRRHEKIKSTGGADKAIVHGILQRGDKKTKRTSKVIAQVVPNAKLNTLSPIIHNSIEVGSNLYSDTAAAYTSHSFSASFIHEMIDHAQAYVQGRCHTNGMENYWSLFKRMIKGTYVSVDAPHLGRYVDEEMFRFNERGTNDAGRFALVMPGVVGKRLTYKELIGANSEGRIDGAVGGASAN